MTSTVLKHELDGWTHMAYRTDKANTDGKEVLACARCKNRAWTVVYDDQGDQYPSLVCTACATDCGTFGWVSKE